ncbi:MAG: hypothetical protein KF845_06405 [Cyclobacteriaceae bacterium]|nr:hypothetical protein [Cyclobacteriaceae bacterium]
MNVEGYVPVYGTTENTVIRLLTPQVVKNPGKIYLYENYLLINEVNRGIHIYNNEDPAIPLPVGFAELTGNTDMAIRNGILYADHMGSLVALTTNDFTELAEVGRLPISKWLLGVPPPSQSYFECIDSSKGVVIGWKKQTLKDPDCYAL